MLKVNSERAAPSHFIYPKMRAPLVDVDKSDRGAKTILIVEDDVDVMMTLNARLRKEGFQTIPAPDGFSALTVAERKDIDGVILDINLPGLDGWAVLDRIACPPERVFIVSASRDTGYRHRAERTGCFGFLEKPFTGAYLADRVCAMVA